MNKLGEPVELIRRYDKVVSREAVPLRALNPPFLQGLLIYSQYRKDMRPLFLCLTPERTLRKTEYAAIAYEVSIPRLAVFFPTVPKRQKQTWGIPRSAVQIVSGKLPLAENFELTGKLEQVVRSQDGKSLVAQIGITGTFDIETAQSSFAARILFEFEPRGFSRPAAGVGEDVSKVIQANGRITRAALSHAKSEAAPPNGNTRLRKTLYVDRVIERRPLGRLPGEPGTPVAPLTLPETTPTPTQANSWITYDDPAGRFHFRHPQELAPNDPTRPQRRTRLSWWMNDQPAPPSSV